LIFFGYVAGLLIPATTVLNQFGFVLFIGVAIDTFVVRTVLVPAAVTAFTLPSFSFHLSSRGISFKSQSEVESGYQPHMNPQPDDGTEMSVFRWRDVDANWWPSLMPRVVLSPLGEDEALWAGYDSPQDYLLDMKATHHSQGPALLGGPEE
jgi:hypothetical protein